MQEERFEDRGFIRKIRKGKKNGADSYICCCPAHRDKEPSLSIKETDERILLHCHAGCSTEMILGAIGLEMKYLFKQNNTYTLTWREKVKVWQDPKKGDLRLEALYPYYDDQLQNVLYYKARYEGKEIRHFRVKEEKVIWKNVFKNINKTLYNKSAIKEAKEQQKPIYYVEGEKDVHTLQQLGLLATTAGGATAWLEDFKQYFENLDVIIFQDNDEAGEQLSKKICADLAVVAKTIRVVVPSKEPHGDVTDYLEEGHTKHELLELIEQVEEQKRISEPYKNYRLDDTDNAHTMAIMYKDRLCFAYDMNKWYLYNGIKWEEDRVDGVRILAGKMIERMGHDFALILSKMPEGREKKKQTFLYNMHLKNCRSYRGKSSILNETKHLLPIVSTHFNQPRHLINMPNGTYDINDKQLKEHRATDYLSQVTNVAYVENIAAPNWEKFIKQIFLGDRELMRYVQKAIGYSLTGFTHEQCMFIGYGDGANGKGVFKDILSYILNDYVKCPQAETISQIRQGSEASPDIINLMDARLVVCVESNKGVRFNEGLIKQLTGEDKVTARRLYCEPTSFLPQFKLWLFTNHMPEVVGTDKGIWRRLKVIPFKLDLPEEKKDKHLKEKLMKEVGGILWWCIQGIHLYLEEGLKEPPAVINLVHEFKEESDTLGLFLKECTIHKEGSKVQAKDLYTKYVEWCRANNEVPDNKTRFGLDMKKRIPKESDGRNVYYRDIALVLTVSQFVNVN